MSQNLEYQFWVSLPVIFLLRLVFFWFSVSEYILFSFVELSNQRLSITRQIIPRPWTVGMGGLRILTGSSILKVRALRTPSVREIKAYDHWAKFIRSFKSSKIFNYDRMSYMIAWSFEPCSRWWRSRKIFQNGKTVDGSYPAKSNDLETASRISKV